MALTLRSPWRDRERILVFGPQGAGKSVGALSIARAVTDVKFHIIDIDHSPSYNRFIDRVYPELNDPRINVTVVDPEDWEATMEAIVEARVACGPDDWVVIDSATPSWNAVQGWFIEKVQGSEIEDYFMQVRMRKKEAGDAKKALGALDGWLDWPVINKQYFKLYRELTRIKGHVYMTAESARIGEEDDREMRGRFGPYGVKPAGQKRIGFVPATVLLLTKDRVGKHYMTTCKDRGPEEVEDQEIGDFAVDYLRRLAGWKVVKS